ncbi:MAG TPA: hypothetical protein PK351_10380 [Spirochaetota bacterium]|nr:hypothetical protein [Spirochaetota bacterium]
MKNIYFLFDKRIKYLIIGLAIIFLLFFAFSILYVVFRTRYLLFLFIFVHILFFLWSVFFILYIFNTINVLKNIMVFLKKELDGAVEKYTNTINGLKEIFKNNCEQYNYFNECDVLLRLEKLCEENNNLKNYFLEIMQVFKMKDILKNFQNLIKRGTSHIIDYLSIFEDVIKKSIEYKKRIIKQNEDLVNIFIYPVTYSIDITRDWKEHFEKIFDKMLNQNLIQLEIIKKINEDDLIIINDILENFKTQHEKSSLYSIKYREGLPAFFNKVDDVKNVFIDSLTKYAKNFEKISNITENINSISEKIRMISLNLSIEASKSSNKSFMIIGKELQKLSLDTQQFIKKMKEEFNSSFKQLEELKEENTLKIEDLNNFIDIYKNLAIEYDTNIKEIEISLNKFIDNVKTSNEENRNLIFSIFYDIQRVSIIKEQVDHKDKFLSNGLEEILNYYTILLQKEDLLNITEDKKREIYKNLLDKIRSFVSTKEERNYLNELYKKYLDIEIDDGEFKDKDIIIF